MVGVLYALSLFAITPLKSIPSGVVEEGVKATGATKARVGLLVPSVYSSTWSRMMDCPRWHTRAALAENELMHNHTHTA